MADCLNFHTLERLRTICKIHAGTSQKRNRSMTHEMYKINDALLRDEFLHFTFVEMNRLIASKTLQLLFNKEILAHFCSFKTDESICGRLVVITKLTTPVGGGVYV